MMINKLLIRLNQDEQGSVLILFAASLVPLLLLTGVTLDTTRSFIIRQKLALALDAAALGASQYKETEKIKNKAKQYLEANFPHHYWASKIQSLGVDVKEQAGVVKIRARAQFPTWFMGILGKKYMSVTTYADVGVYRAKSLEKGFPFEVALVVDNGDLPFQEINDFKIVLPQFIDSLLEKKSNPAQKIGAVFFSDTVNVGARPHFVNITSQYTQSFCAVGERGDDIKLDAPPEKNNKKTLWKTDPQGNCGEAIQPLSPRGTAIKATLEHMQGLGKSRVSVGVAWGWRILSPEWRGLWRGKKEKSPVDYYKTGKYIVFVTAAGSAVSKGNKKSDIFSVCQSAQQAGVKIYAVGYRVKASVKDILKGCATNDLYVFEAHDQISLKDTMIKIGETIKKGGKTPRLIK